LSQTKPGPKQSDSSRVLILEDLVDDVNYMKARYEADYLASHREKLVLRNELEEMRGRKVPIRISLALGNGII
jgi:hypothetical protein